MKNESRYGLLLTQDNLVVEYYNYKIAVLICCALSSLKFCTNKHLGCKISHVRHHLILQFQQTWKSCLDKKAIHLWTFLACCKTMKCCNGFACTIRCTFDEAVYGKIPRGVTRPL